MTSAIGVKQSHKAWERLGSHFKDRFLFHYFEHQISLTGGRTLLRLLSEGCYGYLLVPSLITKHSCHQFSRHQFPCSSISDEFNNQPMGYIRCYAYFLKYLSFPWRFQQEGVGLWGDFTGKLRTHRIIQTIISRNPVPYCSFETRVVTSSCNFIIFAFSNFAELTLFHIMADDKQKFHAFLE